MSVYTSCPHSREGIRTHYSLNWAISSLEQGLNNTDWV